MNEHLPVQAKPPGEMGVKVAGEETYLKEDHARVPDGWRSSEDRQDHPREHRLHREQQHGRREERHSKQQAEERSPAPVVETRSGCPTRVRPRARGCVFSLTAV